jgi:hypothetical protein
VALLSDRRHEVSLLNALATLCEEKSPCFSRIYTSLQSHALQTTLLHLIYTHKHSQRCPLYMYAFKDMNGKKELRHTDLPWKCWPCLAKILRLKTIDSYRPFINGAIRNKLYEPHLHDRYILDILVSLYLMKKDHAVRLVFETFRRYVKSEERAKNLLTEFLSQPCIIDKLFTKTCKDFIPFVWQNDGFMKELEKKALDSVKAYNYVFKEDLIIKTWAPHRIFAWCFDLDELKDFD